MCKLRISNSYFLITNFPLMNMRCFSLSFLITRLNVDFILYLNSDSSLFLGFICLKNYFPAFCSEVVSVFVTEVHFLYAEKCWVQFTYPVCLSISFYWGIEFIDIKGKTCCFLLVFLLEVELCLFGFLWLSSFWFVKRIIFS